MGQNKMLVVIDYNMGNVRSVAKAFDLIGANVKISRNKNEIEAATHLVLPGVGAFAEGMKNLKRFGLVDRLRKEVIENKKPILGICLGMQLMSKSSEEFGKCNGLGWVNAEVKPFQFADKNFPVPHVGWNDVNINTSCPLFKNIRQKPIFYFVHSYCMSCSDNNLEAASCEYGHKFTAAIWRDNIYATQFHPEKSQSVGLNIIENFVSL